MKKLLQKTGALLLLLCSLLPLQRAGAQVITIGTGTFSSTLYNPVSVGGLGLINPATAPKNAHIQVVYSAASINAAGMTTAGMIDSIAWDVATVPSRALINYTIKGKLQNAASITAFSGHNLTQLFTQPSFLPVAGWTWIRFQTPLYWNGVDNSLFDICSDTVTASVSGTVRLTNPTTGPPTWVAATALTPLCGVYTSTTSGLRLRPNIKMSFRAVTCTGVPASIAITPAGPLQGCAGNYRLLQLGSVPPGAYSIQWQKSVNSGPWTDITPGGNSVAYNAQIISGQSNKYRAVIACTVTNTSVTSNEVTVNAVADPVFAALPYSQDFETWMDRCATNDAPDSSWVNLNGSGPFSWRREDQGASAGWTSDVNPLYYLPLSSTGSHSARIQSSKGPGTGSLLLHVNCSGTGNKELRFDYMSKTGSNNNLQILASTNGGATYDSLATFGSMGVNAQWQSYVVQIPSSSANTIIQFKSISSGYQAGDFDMGIDNVHVYPACDGKPVAGTVDSGSACQGAGVTLSLSGSSLVAGLNWRWQQTTDGITWSDVAGGNVEHPTTPLDAATWFRCILTCTNSGQSDTTAPQLFALKSFFNCYCNSGSTVASPGLNIGNVKVFAPPVTTPLVDNGNPLPATGNLQAKKHYTDYTHVAPADMYRDSTYKLLLTFFTSNGTNVSPQMGKTYTKVWIDFDHSGTFDAAEQVMGHSKAAGVYVDSANFVIPATATAGITGMRIVTNDVYDTTLIQPCGPYSYGETEDYLVRLWNMPCNGSADPGTVTASDSLACPGYPFTLTHSGYDSTSGQTVRTWQSSANGTSWADITGADNIAVRTQLFTGKQWYRVKTVCNATASNSYSDSVLVNLSNACYCVSYADGGFAGTADSSDVGGFSFASMSFPLTGGHLNNPDAVRKYTSRTYLAPVSLWADSTYNFTIDHTLLRGEHADAKVTLFIDYNGNGTYDIPAERVYSAVSTSSTWHKTGQITIPSGVITGQSVGMRLIINNDTAANAPSDEACGIYTSGETEDYWVRFDKFLAIGDVTNILGAIHIFPNPTTGVTSVQYRGKSVKQAALKVTNITGQVLETLTLPALEYGQVIKLNLEGYAKGIYFITLGAEGRTVTGKVAIH